MKKFAMYLLSVVFVLIGVACHRNDPNWEISGCKDVKERIRYYLNENEYPGYTLRAQGEICGKEKVREQLACVAAIENKACGELTVLTNKDQFSALYRWANVMVKKVYEGINKPEPEMVRMENGLPVYELKPEISRDEYVSSWDFYRAERAIKNLKEYLDQKFELTLTDLKLEYRNFAFSEANKKYQAKYADQLLRNLKLYPAKPLKDEPSVYLKMLIEADNGYKSGKKYDIASKYVNEAYLRIAEQILIELRAGKYEYPNSHLKVEAIRKCLHGEKYTLADIGTSDAELKKLERRYPTLK